MSKLVNYKVIRNAATYAGSNILLLSVPFLLIPVFTRYLTPTDYGTVATFYSAVAIFSVIVGLQVNSAITVHYFDFNKEDVAHWTGDAFKIVFCSFLFWFAMALAFKNALAGYLHISSWLLPLIPIMAMTNTIFQTHLSRLRVEHNALYHGLSNLSRTIVDALLSILLVVILHLQWEGRIIGMFAASLIAGTAGFTYLYATKKVTFGSPQKYSKSILNFSIPMIPHALGGWVLSLSDRLILPLFTNLHETGLYNIGYSFGQVIMFITSAINQAWTPALYEKLKLQDPAINRLIIKRTFQYKLGIIILGMLAIFIIPQALVLMVGEKFHSSYQYVPWITAGYIFEALRSTTMSYIAFSKKTHYLAKIMFLTSLINISLNIWLIPKYGAIAAAWSTLISYFFSYIFTLYAAYCCRDSFPTKAREAIAK